MTEFDILLMNELLAANAALEQRLQPTPAWVETRRQQIEDLCTHNPRRYGSGFAQYWSEDRLDREWQRQCGPRAAEIQAAELRADEVRLAILMGEIGDIGDIEA